MLGVGVTAAVVVAWSTVRVVGGDVGEASKLASPPYVAVMEGVPSTEDSVRQGVARPDAVVGSGSRVTMHSGVVPDMTLTDPVGAPEGSAVTVTPKLTVLSSP